MFLLASSTATAQIDQRENEVLEQWLQDRELDSLLLEHLESRLESTTDTKSREQVAQRLAILYGQELLTADGATQDLIDRTRSLIALYPQFKSGRLRVAMLHARYIEGERAFRDWIGAGAAAEPKQDLKQNLTQLDQDLSATILSLRNRSEELFASEQLNRDQRPGETERQMVDAEALHCQFLAGWTRYFRALVEENDQTDSLAKAELGFREFLQLDPQTILSDFDSKWFDFSSVWHVRAMAGLAAIETARKNESLSTRLYELMKSNAVSRDSREAVIRFRYLGHCYCGQFADAMNVLRDQGSIRAMSREGRVRLWATVLDTSQATDSAEIKRLGLTGLTRNLAGELLVLELEKETAAAIQEENFESLWTRGYAEFWKSQNDDDAAAEKAANLLQQALRVADDTANVDDKTRCRYLQAWLMLTRRELENAIDTFSDVAEQLSSVDPQLASEAAWLAARTSIQLGKRDPSQTNEAWNRLGRFVRTWPDSPNAPRAGFEKLRIELRSMPAEVAIDRLKEISKNDENYGASLFEIAAQNFRLYETQTNDPKSMARLQQACLNVQSSNDTSLLHKARSGFLMANVLLRSKSIPAKEIDSMLARCDAWLAQADDADQAIVEMLYYRLQLQQREGDSEAAFKTASEIVERGSNSRFEVQALIELAKRHDAKLETSPSDRKALEAAIGIYQQLSQRLGRKSDQLKSSANARVALSRLGQLQQVAGLNTESESSFQQLVNIFPSNANYLRSLAIAKGNRDIKGATEIWRRLASGSDPGSDLWFAAKLELANSLAGKDRAAAVRLIEQTMQLGGELPPQWQQKYDSILTELSDGEDNP